MVDLVPLISCPESEIPFPTSINPFSITRTSTSSRSLDTVQAKDETDARDVPLPAPNDTGVTEDITCRALEALVRFQQEEQRKARFLGNNEGNDVVEAADSEYFDDHGDKDEAQDDEDEYWGSDINGECQGDGEADFVESPVAEDLASAANEYPDKVDGNYLDTAEDYSEEFEAGVDDRFTGAPGDDINYDDDYEDPELSFVAIPFAERYYGVAGHQPEDPDKDDWSGSDYSSEPDYSEGEDFESDSQDYYKKGDARQKRSRRTSLFTQYKRILPPNLFASCDPPSQFPTEPIYKTPDSLDIPQGIYALVKDIALDSLLCQVVMARSMMMRVNGYGLKKGELCCIKIYSKNHETAERRRKSINQLKTEIKAYQRLAEAPRRDKPGFLFLMQLNASLQDESSYFLIMPLMKADLRTILQKDGLPRAHFARELEIRRLLAQMAVGIATLHSMGIIHRDLKPENILIDFYGNVQIADFGVSMIGGSCEPCVNGKKYCWESVGTWPYAAPELATAQNPLYGLEVDYWALGCVAFEMEAWGHQELFVNTTEYEYWCSIGGGSVRKRLEFMAFADLSQCAFVLVCGLLHPDPVERYGLLALMKHPYFMENGVSEFHCLGERAARRQREPFIPSVVPHPPVKYAPRAADDTPHGWINPRGAFYP